jgi:ribosomal protein S18 acetylase RimI-like enzyme
VLQAVAIRALSLGDAVPYRDLRLRALREHPEAFTSSYEEEREDAQRWVAKRLGAAPEQSVVFGAVVLDGSLCGMSGVERLSREKERHKAHLYGMYVTPERAGNGIGRALVERVIECCRGWPGVEQIGLSVTGGNAAARRLYESAGFQRFGRETHALKLGARYFDKEHMSLFLGTQASS